MECAGDLEGDDTCARRRVLSQQGQRIRSAGHHDLSAAVVVRRLQAELIQLSQQLGLVGAEHGAHAGRGLGRRGGHRLGSLAHEGDRIRLGEDAGAHGSGDLAHRVPGDPADPVTAAVVEECAECE